MRKFHTIFLGKNTPTGASDWGVMEEFPIKGFALLLTGTEAQCKQLALWMNEDEAKAAKAAASPASSQTNLGLGVRKN